MTAALKKRSAAELKRLAARNKRPREVPAKVIECEPKKRRLVVVAQYPEGTTRPATRGDCASVPRPCPWVGCRHNLYLDVQRSGSIKLNFPDLEVWEMGESCALDAADGGSLALHKVGERMNITRERVRQLEVEILGKYEGELGLRRLLEEMA